VSRTRSTRRARIAALSLSAIGLVAMGSACTSAPAPGGGGGAAPAPGGGCTAVEVLAARGTTEPQSGSFIMGGLSNGIAQRTQGNVYQVRYPAVADFVNGPNQGAADALARLNARAAACPNQKYVLNGYSQGAMVMTVLMGRIPANLQSRVVAAVLYGNPYYKSSSPSAAGTAKGRANGIVPIAGIPAAFANKTRDYCNAGDPVCGGGANFMAHVGYGTYQADGIAFAVGKVNGG
jgi:cutinase